MPRLYRGTHLRRTHLAPHRFGAPVTITSERRLTFDWLDDEEHPLQTFEFRYRSRREQTSF